MDNKEELINELRDCAAELVKMANDETLVKKASTESTNAVKTERIEYMEGLMKGLGLEE